MPRETKESVRISAPVNYAAQNRAVTAADYKTLITNNFPTLKDVSVWGGEDANPPVYGKVFIAPALWSQQPAGEILKKEITDFLRYHNIGSITTEVVDAEYTYVTLEVGYKFDLQSSSLSLNEADALVRDTVVSYSDVNLNRFDGILRQSRLTTLIDSADVGIQNSIIRPKMYKKFRPDPYSVTSYELLFPVSIYQSSSSESVATSSWFSLNGQMAMFQDEPTSDTNVRKLYLVDPTTNERLDYYNDVGYINLSNGIFTINNLRFDSSDYVVITVRPNTYDIAPKYKQLLAINAEDVTVIGEMDTVSAYNIKGLSSYKPFTRHS